MSARRLLPLLLLALPLPARPSYYQLNGSVDSGYYRSETTSAGQTTRAPGWDFGAQLALNFAPIRPELLQAMASATYRLLEAGASENSSRTQQVGYNATLTALQGLPLSLSGFASRSQSDFSTTAAAQQTGRSLATGVGGALSFHRERLPTVGVSVARNDFENTGLGGQQTTGSTTTLSASAAHQLENHGYAATYDTSWNSGTFADTNYRTHRFALSANSHLGEALDLRLNQQYFLRAPTQLAATSPRFDDNVFGADTTWRPSSTLVGSASYAYHHLVADFRGLGDNRESTTHAVRAATDWLTTPEIALTGSVGAGTSEDRLGDVSARSSGESVGAGIRWTRTTRLGTFMANGSGSAGLSQASGSDQGAYGAGAGAGWNGTLGSWSSSLAASSSYDSNLLGQMGWAVRTQVTASADTRTIGGLAFRSQLQLSDTRQYNPLLGDSSSQGLQALLILGYRVHSLSLTTGLTNAAAQGLSGPTGSQIVSTQLNTTSRYATLTATTVLLRGLTLTGLARYLDVTAPARPDTWESAFDLRLTWRVGLFDLSAEDRYTLGAQGGPRIATNLVIFRIARSFGASF